MAEKTMVEKAAETVGYGLAMAEDVAGSLKTAVGAAMTTVTKALKKAPPKKRVAKKVVAQPAAKKAPAKKAAKKTVAKLSPAKKNAAKKASKKSVKKPTKKAARARR